MATRELRVTKMNTGVVRFSYLSAIEPRAQDGGEPKYSAVLLIPKEDTVTINKIKECINNAIMNDREGRNLLSGIKAPLNPLHDGDGLTPKGKEYGVECRGCYVVNASSKQQPGLVDRYREPLKDPAEWYSGIYGRANVTFYAYNKSGNAGIACALNHLQKVKDGIPLAGAGDPKTAFDDGFVGDADESPLFSINGDDIELPF